MLLCLGGLSPLHRLHEICGKEISVRDSRICARDQSCTHTCDTCQLDSDIVNQIRDTLKEELVLGSDYFKEEVEKVLQRSVRRGKVGRPKINEEEGFYRVN